MSRDGTHTIAYAGCTEAGFEVLRRLHEEGMQVAEIISLTPDQAADNHVSGYHSYEPFADTNDIPVYYPETYGMGGEADLTHFEGLDADLLIVNGWQRLIPGEILRTFPRGALGVHGSAYGLPKGRGRSPMNWSLIEDLDRFLLSVIQLDEGADSGQIADTVKYDISDHDTIQTLYYKLVIATQEILLETVPQIFSGEFEYTEQGGTPTYYPKRSPEDGAIHWEEPTRRIYNLVRAVTKPYPGAITEHEGTEIKIWEAIPFSDDFVFEASPGTIVQVFETTGEFVVKTADGTLLVRDWKAENWSPVRGQQLTSLPNESLDSPARVDRPEHEENLSG
jgi:methionyl-tRNA formyltransferase